jgi:hypothetical protein
VILTSRWFPPILAAVQTLVHVSLIAYEYRPLIVDGERFDCMYEDLSNDLACGTYRPYSVGHSADLGLNLPAYLALSLLYFHANLEFVDIDAVTIPRGQRMIATLVPLVWFFLGCSVRRVARRRWRRADHGRWQRASLWVALLPALYGLLAIPMGAGGLFLGRWGSFQVICFGLWATYAAALAAERLRVWPFAKIEATP